MALACEHSKPDFDKFEEKINNREEPSYLSIYKDMTNVSFLESISEAVYHLGDSDWKKKYILKIDELRNLSEEVSLIFPGETGSYLSKFVYNYEEMLVEIVNVLSASETHINNLNNKAKSIKIMDYDKLEFMGLANTYIEGTFALADEIYEKNILTKAKQKI